MHQALAAFDRFGSFELADPILREYVAGGGVSVLQTTSTPTDANCLNGVCFDDGNSACASVNPLCVDPSNATCRRINPLKPSNGYCGNNYRCPPPPT